MADTAAHLVDRVLPDVPIRQWVLSIPVAMRYRLAYDAKLTREVLHIFVQSLFASLRRRAKQRYGIRNAECGGVTLVQGFGGAIYVAKLLMLYNGRNYASFNQLVLKSQHNKSDKDPSRVIRKGEETCWDNSLPTTAQACCHAIKWRHSLKNESSSLS
jgi:hypothetical protein